MTSGLGNMIRRNVKLFFRDKGMFFVSLITPGILLILYISFLGNIYRASFTEAIPEGLTVDAKLINSLAASQLVSSLLAVSCVTVAFCSNMVMIRDRLNGARSDFDVTPIKSSTLSISYFVSAAISTLTICFVTLAIGLVYIAAVGWYFSAGDLICLILDTFLAALFGTAISSVVNSFVRSQGQMSAVSSIISSVYGFICGAYMPISNFSDWLQKTVHFLPGTYVTSLFRNHTMRGVLSAMSDAGIPKQLTDGFAEFADCTPDFFGHTVTVPVMYAIVAVTTLVLIGVYVLVCRPKKTVK